MADYSKLINNLHDAAKEIDSFYYNKEWTDLIDLLNDAADAIEDLSKKPTRKKPPKRLPCLCGRKQLDTWATANPKGWFLRCPNCGIESKVVRYLCDLNTAWNNMITEKGKE